MPTKYSKNIFLYILSLIPIIIATPPYLGCGIIIILLLNLLMILGTYETYLNFGLFHHLHHHHSGAPGLFPGKPDRQRRIPPRPAHRPVRIPGNLLDSGYGDVHHCLRCRQMEKEDAPVPAPAADGCRA